MPKFSILIVSYNSAKDLDRVFNCLDRQKIRDFETILIDNASPESPPNSDLINRASQYIANQENIGFARANNQGAKIANGEWLILLNPDAFPNADWLEEIDEAIKKYPKCENFGCLQLLDNYDGLLDGAGDCFSIAGIAWRGGHGKPIPFTLEDGVVFSTCGAASIWKTQKYLELNGFEESYNSYYEDVDLGFRHKLSGGQSIQLAKAIVSHRASGSSGRYSYYAVFHGTRNRLWAFIRLMPSLLFYICLPIHILATLALYFQALRRGAHKAYWNGIMAGLKGAGAAFKERKIIQSQRKASIFAILRPMSFSPLALLTRAIILRKIK